MVKLRAVLAQRAEKLGRQFNSRAAAKMRSCVACGMSPRPAPDS